MILFHFIWNKYFLFKKINSENNATGCRLWSTGSDRSQSSVVNSMQKGPSEIAIVQISLTEYITKCYRNMVDQIPHKRILRPGNQWESRCLHRRPCIWNSHRAVRHVIMEHTRELSLEQKLNLHQVGDPIKRHTDLFKYGYKICIELAIFVRMDSVPHKFSF